MKYEEIIKMDAQFIKAIAKAKQNVAITSNYSELIVEGQNYISVNDRLINFTKDEIDVINVMLCAKSETAKEELLIAEGEYADFKKDIEYKTKTSKNKE